MDPQATLEAILDAIRDADAQAARDRVRDLEDWARVGGYLPSGFYDAVSQVNDLEREIESLLV